jgi:hypothetical protein
MKEALEAQLAYLKGGIYSEGERCRRLINTIELKLKNLNNLTKEPDHGTPTNAVPSSNT